MTERTLRTTIGLAFYATLLVSGCATLRSVSYPSTDSTSKLIFGDVKIWSELTKPEGDGLFPAVVLLHGCAGPIADLDPYWAADLTRWGYVTIRPDSFTSRGIANVCGQDFKIGPKIRAQDAYDALKYLSSLPFVDIDRVAVMGWSHGGWSTLEVTDTNTVRDQKRRFKAAIAFYPWCGWRASGAEFYAPMLVLIGSEDDWTSASLCQGMVKHRKSTDVPLDIVVYEGAYHSFDIRRPLRAYLGHALGYDGRATTDATKRVKDFLARHLR